MPFYEYECASCRYYLEVLQKISDKPLKKCPSCGKSALKRLMSAPVFRLKGSGWYETDFKSDKEGQRNLAGADPAESKAPEAKAGSDDKAVAKPETGASADKGKADSAAPAAEAKSAKGATTAGRSLGAKRALKRSAPRSRPKSPRAAKRATRRR